MGKPHFAHHLKPSPVGTGSNPLSVAEEVRGVNGFRHINDTFQTHRRHKREKLSSLDRQVDTKLTANVDFTVYFEVAVVFFDSFVDDMEAKSGP